MLVKYFLVCWFPIKNILFTNFIWACSWILDRFCYPWPFQYWPTRLHGQDANIGRAIVQEKVSKLITSGNVGNCETGICCMGYKIHLFSVPPKVNCSKEISGVKFSIVSWNEEIWWSIFGSSLQRAYSTKQIYLSITHSYLLINVIWVNIFWETLIHRVIGWFWSLWQWDISECNFEEIHIYLTWQEFPGLT